MKGAWNIAPPLQPSHKHIPKYTHCTWLHLNICHICAESQWVREELLWRRAVFSVLWGSAVPLPERHWYHPPRKLSVVRALTNSILKLRYMPEGEVQSPAGCILHWLLAWQGHGRGSQLRRFWDHPTQVLQRLQLSACFFFFWQLHPWFTFST